MTFTLALIQPIAFPPPDDEKNVSDAVRFVEKASAAGADLVVFPEMSVTLKMLIVLNL